MMPKFTIMYNIVSPENNKWIGTGWEFFDNENEAYICFNRHKKLGKIPIMREYHPNDEIHLDIVHRFTKKETTMKLTSIDELIAFFEQKLNESINIHNEIIKAVNASKTKAGHFQTLVQTLKWLKNDFKVDFTQDVNIKDSI